MTVSMAEAANFTLESTADAVDAKPGDGHCNYGSGNCTLRAARIAANTLAGTGSKAIPAATYMPPIVSTSGER